MKHRPTKAPPPDNPPPAATSPPPAPTETKPKHRAVTVLEITLLSLKLVQTIVAIVLHESSE